jgi:multidrug efflux pump subunit AcrA (membrane-fusion protein)
MALLAVGTIAGLLCGNLYLVWRMDRLQMEIANLRNSIRTQTATFQDTLVTNNAASGQYLETLQSELSAIIANQAKAQAQSDSRSREAKHEQQKPPQTELSSAKTQSQQSANADDDEELIPLEKPPESPPVRNTARRLF